MEKQKVILKKFSEFVNAKYCIGVANGTDAIEISLESLKLKKILKSLFLQTHLFQLQKLLQDQD